MMEPSENVPSSFVVTGRVFPPGSSRSDPASLTVTGKGGEVRGLLLSGEGTTVFDRKTVSVSERLGRMPRRLTLADGRTFVADDNDGMDTLVRLLGGRPAFHWVTRMERFHPRMIVVLLLASVLSITGIRFGIPLLCDAVAEIIPDRIERLVGEAAYQSLQDNVLKPSELPPETAAHLQSVFERVRAQSRVPTATLLLHKGGMLKANALALPGGLVVMTDELATMMPNDDALAWVLGHEIAHIEERHGLKRIVRVSLWVTVGMLVTADIGDFVDAAANAAVGVAGLSYSRDIERDADARGYALMQAVGYDAQKVVPLLELFDKKCGKVCQDMPWLASHPPSLERTISDKPAW